MKKIALCICLMAILALSAAMPVWACWAQPTAFEILSEDGSRVFVFVPDIERGISAYAAVYEIVNAERQTLYTVEDLDSFAYESNFHFSADMTHFIRTFPAPGMPVFEVFSYGVRTRVVQRSEFIEDYESAGHFTSIGPSFTVGWQIENRLSVSDTITISTEEGNTFVFDITTAEFVGDSLPLFMQSAQETPSAWTQDSAERADELGLLLARLRAGFGRNPTRAGFTAIAIALYEHFNDGVGK